MRSVADVLYVYMMLLQVLTFSAIIPFSHHLTCTHTTRAHHIHTHTCVCALQYRTVAKASLDLLLVFVSYQEQPASDQDSLPAEALRGSAYAFMQAVLSYSAKKGMFMCSVHELCWCAWPEWRWIV